MVWADWFERSTCESVSDFSVKGDVFIQWSELCRDCQRCCLKGSCVKERTECTGRWIKTSTSISGSTLNMYWGSLIAPVCDNVCQMDYGTDNHTKNQNKIKSIEPIWINAFPPQYIPILLMSTWFNINLESRAVICSHRFEDCGLGESHTLQSRETSAAEHCKKNKKTKQGQCMPHKNAWISGIERVTVLRLFSDSITGI